MAPGNLEDMRVGLKHPERTGLGSCVTLRLRRKETEGQPPYSGQRGLAVGKDKKLYLHTDLRTRTHARTHALAWGSHEIWCDRHRVYPGL